MMKKQNLFDNMLDMVGGSVSGEGFDLLGKIKSLHAKKKLKYASAWGNEMSRKYKIAPDLATVSAYDECVTWEIKKGRKVVFVLLKPDLNGKPVLDPYSHDSIVKVCTIEVEKVPESMLVEYVDAEIRYSAQDRFLQEERDRCNARVEEIYREMIAKAKAMKLPPKRRAAKGQKASPRR